MNTLDHSHVVEITMQAILLKLFETPAVVTRQAKTCESVSVRPFDCIEYVGTISRAANSDQELPVLSVIHQLLYENLVVAEVISDCHQPACIVG